MFFIGKMQKEGIRNEKSCREGKRVNSDLCSILLERVNWAVALSIESTTIIALTDKELVRGALLPCGFQQVICTRLDRRFILMEEPVKRIFNP